MAKGSAEQLLAFSVLVALGDRDEPVAAIEFDNNLSDEAPRGEVIIDEPPQARVAQAAPALHFSHTLRLCR